MAGIKTELAKQGIVRHIREGSLKPGDRLPALEELRMRLGFGSATIAAALHELRADRVLEVRDKIGVFVVNPDADGYAGREIGLAVNVFGGSAFCSSLANLIQFRLAERGWRVVPFFCMESNGSGEVDLSRFPGLRRTIERKGIEALVSLTEFSPSSLRFLQAQKLPMIFVGTLKTDSARIVIDMPEFLRAAIAKLHSEGCRRPALLAPDVLRSRLEPEFAALRGTPELMFSGVSAADGAAAARRIRQLPAAKQPDGVVIFNDVPASGFLAELYRLHATNHPRTVILRNRQNVMDFADDNPIFFEIDLDVLAKLTSTLLWKQFSDGPVNDDELKYSPRLVLPTPE